VHGLAAALNGYERSVSRGLAGAGADGSLDSSVAARRRTLRDAAASPPSSSPLGAASMAVPEAVLRASDDARVSLAACEDALRYRPRPL
jgi:hypothetical protein